MIRINDRIKKWKAVRKNKKDWGTANRCPRDSCEGYNYSVDYGIDTVPLGKHVVLYAQYLVFQCRECGAKWRHYTGNLIELHCLAHLMDEPKKVA